MGKSKCCQSKPLLTSQEGKVAMIRYDTMSLLLGLLVVCFRAADRASVRVGVILLGEGNGSHCAWLFAQIQPLIKWNQIPHHAQTGLMHLMIAMRIGPGVFVKEENHYWYPFYCQ